MYLKMTLANSPGLLAGKNSLNMSMKMCSVSFPLGQSWRKPSYHSRISPSSYLTMTDSIHHFLQTFLTKQIHRHKQCTSFALHKRFFFFFTQKTTMELPCADTSSFIRKSDFGWHQGHFTFQIRI